MCNLYTNRKSAAEVASYFNVVAGVESNASSEVYPGTPGYVVTQGTVRSMIWGFPLVTADMRERASARGKIARPKPVNNTRMDKIGSPFWRRFVSDPAHRCLIPVERFAEPEGEKGKMTRTWFSVAGEDLFACAGIWRASAEWGSVYSMMMTDANELVAPIHNRMPVVLGPESWSDWLDGGFNDVERFQAPFAATRMSINRTSSLWAGR